MSTAYYIVDEKAKNIRKKEYENLLDLIEKIDDTVEIYCADGKLSVGTLDDIQNSLNTWEWFVDKEYGCSAECCGTECLRDYKIWGGCYRSNVFPEENKYSHEFGKCYVNFTRSTKNKEKTIEEVSQEYIMQEMKRKKQLDEIKHNQQLTLF